MAALDISCSEGQAGKARGSGEGLVHCQPTTPAMLPQRQAIHLEAESPLLQEDPSSPQLEHLMAPLGKKLQGPGMLAIESDADWMSDVPYCLVHMQSCSLPHMLLADA